MELAGDYAVPFQPSATTVGGQLRDVPAGGAPPVGPPSAWPATSRYFNDRAGSIYAGTNEIQRNIMAKAILGV